MQQFGGPAESILRQQTRPGCNRTVPSPCLTSQAPDFIVLSQNGGFFHKNPHGSKFKQEFFVKIDISTGELVDKVTILSIKLEKITSPEKLQNVQNEYDILIRPMNEAGITVSSDEYLRLKAINLRLWDIEDKIRIKESAQAFDEEFISLARSVYFINDDRAAVKKEINLKYNSELVEEKQYVDYKTRS